MEICDRYTDNHGKFSDAPGDYLRYFQIASELLARQHEGMTGYLRDVESADLVDQFCRLEDIHGMLGTLRGVQPSDQQFEENRHTLLIINQNTDAVEVLVYPDFRTAIGEYFKIEREKGNDIDVVLVAADDSESVRFGFKNYFSDAREFVTLVDEACTSLS